MILPLSPQLDYSEAVIALDSRIAFVEVTPSGLELRLNGEHHFVAVVWRDMAEERMKFWIALPADLSKYRGSWHGGAISSSAMCPNLTLEMVQDNVAWYEMEILRKMPQKEESPDERNARHWSGYRK